MSDTCHDFQQLMTDALDGRLDAADRARFERLLAESEDRRREWDAYREMRDLLLAIGTESAPADLARTVGDAVRAAEDPIESQPESVSSWSHLRTMGLARAAALVVALIAVAVVLSTEFGLDAAPASREVADVGSEEVTDPKGLASDGVLVDGVTADDERPESEMREGHDFDASVLGRAERRAADKQLGFATPDVMDEALYLLQQNLGRLSLGELESRGVAEFGAVADRRAQERQVDLLRERQKQAEGVLAGEKRRKELGDKKASVAPPKTEQSGRRVLKGKAERGGGGARARAATGAPPRAVATDTPPPSSAAGVAPGLALEADALAQTLVPPASRLFFVLVGPDALTRTRKLMGSVSGVRELSARPAFEKNGEVAKPSAQSGKARNTKGKTQRSSPTKDNANPAKPGYKIFQVTLPMAEADGLVGRLESQSGLVLRSLGKSVLPGLRAGAEVTWGGPGGAVQKPKGGGIPPMRTIVLVVLER